MIIHLMIASIYSKNYIKFIKKYFNIEKHCFVIYQKDNPQNIEFKVEKNILLVNNLRELIKFYAFFSFKKYKKIIIHGFYWPYLGIFYFIKRNYLKKSYWMMWGGDYSHFNFKPKTIKGKLNKIISDYIKSQFYAYMIGLEEEFNKVKKNYKIKKGKYYKAFYSLGLDKKIIFRKSTNNSMNILVGNSASKLNNHLEIFEKLRKYNNIKIFCPLSYGDEKNLEWTNIVLKKGKEYFEERFIPILKMLPYEEYKIFLLQIDIVILGYDVQAAMGNTSLLLGLGKTAYLKKDSPVKKFLDDNEIVTENFEELIDLKKLDENILKSNSEKINNLFLDEVIIKQWEKIFLD